MIAPLSLSIVVLLVLLGVAALVIGGSGKRPPRLLLAGVVLAEVELLAQAAFAWVAIAGGHRPTSLGEFAGYTFVTLGMLPFAWTRARGPHATRFDTVVVGIVCLVTAVATLRLMSLW